VAATTVRLPDDLHERLTRYCADTGAVMNRVMALALREYLEDEPAPRIVLTPREANGPLAGEPLGARRLVLDLHEHGPDPDKIAEATGLDREQIVAVLEVEP
jgi:hypothetical protein